ncbi:hypothetical protein LguiA_008245 [Lonicera macranthoides]
MVIVVSFPVDRRQFLTADVDFPVAEANLLVLLADLVPREVQPRRVDPTRHPWMVAGGRFLGRRHGDVVLHHRL